MPVRRRAEYAGLWPLMPAIHRSSGAMLNLGSAEVRTALAAFAKRSRSIDVILRATRNQASRGEAIFQVLPALRKGLSDRSKAVLPILETTGRNDAIEMQQIRAVAPAALCFGVTSMDLAVGDDLLWQHKAAPRHGGFELSQDGRVFITVRHRAMAL
jgi:hypothetical protein